MNDLEKIAFLSGYTSKEAAKEKPWEDYLPEDKQDNDDLDTYDEWAEEAIERGDAVSPGEAVSGLLGGLAGGVGGGFAGYGLTDSRLGAKVGVVGGGLLGSTLGLALARAVNRRRNKFVGPNTLVF